MDQLSSTYTEFLLQNAARVQSIESSLKTVSWLVPGRFPDAELASEGLLTVTNLLGLYHDSVLQQAVQTLPEDEKPTPSLQARYTKYWNATSTAYNRAAKALSIIKSIELLLEMTARKKVSMKRKWDVVITLELIKAILRLIMFQASQFRPLIHPPLAEREIDPALFEEKEAHISHQPISSWTGSRTGVTRPTIFAVRKAAQDHTQTSTSAVNAFLAGRVLSVQDVKLPTELVLPLSSIAEKWNECVWILRPLLYVMALKKFGMKSYRPFLLSLVLEQLSLRAGRSRQWSGSDLEKNERARRQRQIWKYLFRGPAWESFTRPKLESICASFDRWPLLNVASSAAQSYADLVESLYYYTS